MLNMPKFPHVYINVTFGLKSSNLNTVYTMVLCKTGRDATNFKMILSPFSYLLPKYFSSSLDTKIYAAS